MTSTDSDTTDFIEPADGLSIWDLLSAATIGVPPVLLAALEGWPVGLTVLAAIVFGLALWSLALRCEAS